MAQRAVFEHIKTDDADLFAIRISGQLSPREREVVEEFFGKCRETGKQKVIFDFSELMTLGGGVAQVFGDFAVELASKGSPPWFVGARGIIRKFLSARFSEGEPCFADTIEEARANMGGAPKAKSAKKKTASQSKTGAKTRSKKPKDEAPDFLEILDAVNETAATEFAVPQPRPQGERPASSGYISLDEALEQLADMSTLPEAEPVLTRLLHSSSLASRSFLFLRTDDGFRQGDLYLARDGILATVVERRHAPIDLIDFVELDLEADEVGILETLNCQVCIPFFGPDRLEGFCFVGKVKLGEEYSAAETFALELLSRQVKQALWSVSAVAPAASNGDGHRRFRTLRSVARQLHESTDAEAILSQLARGLIGEMGISGVIALRLGETGMHKSGGWGQAAIEDKNWPKVPADAWNAVSNPCSLGDIDGDWAMALKDSGCSWFAPLIGPMRFRRGLALSLRDSEDDSAVDAEALGSIMIQAGYALSHSDALDGARSRTLLVSRTLVSLIEKRLGHEGSPETNTVAEYVARLADSMNVDRSELPDLLYGTIMRDIGMIEISDLVLKSPRKLSPEEWKLVQRHPIAGAEILAGMSFSEVACDVVRHHHERFNGQGYPHNLRGTAIPIGARLVSVVESFVAMLRDAPYRPALSEKEALSVLQENWEMRYDPNVIEHFIALMRVDAGPVDIDSLLAGQTPV
jgi:hypothetical protein